MAYPRNVWLNLLHTSTGMVMREITERTGVSETVIQRIVSGQSYDCSLATLRKLSSVYGEGIWLAFGFEPLGYRRAAVQEIRRRRLVRYTGAPHLEMPRCPVCGEMLPDRRAGRRYCGARCRWQAARRAKQRIAEVR